MKRYILYIILLNIGYGQTCSQDIDWCFDVSMMQAFYFFIDVSIDGEDIQSGSVVGPNDGVWECPENDCDIIGAFYNDVCVGWTYPYWNNGYTIPVMLNDGNFPDYLSPGDIPDFRLYNRSLGIIYNAITPTEIPGSYNNSFEIIDYLYNGDEWLENIDYSIELYEGQNLISFFALPDDISVENIMETIEPNILGIIGEGIVASHMGNGNWIGSLSEISREKGYWVKMLHDDILNVSGKPDPIPEMTIYLGNNLVSFPIDDTVSISHTIPDYIEDSFFGIIGQAVVAQNLNNNNNQNDEFWYGSLSTLKRTKGYWFQIEDDDIDYSTPLAFYFKENDELNRFNIAPNSRENNFNYIQSIEQAFYFIESIDGIDIEDDDWILSYNTNQIVGARKWEGNNTDVPAMGWYDDLTDDYCRVGDIPDFYIYNENSGKMIQLFGDIPEWSSNGIFNISLYSQDQIKPEKFIIKSIYPNPFNPITNIEYGLPEDSFVSVSIYDISGRMVDELISSNQLAGYHRVTWDAGAQASGLYFIKLTAGHYQQTQKLMLIK